MIIQHFSPQFGDAAATANAILNSGADYDQGKMMYNRYKSVVSYDTTALPLFSQENVMGAEKITAYDSVDADVVQSYLEFSLASLIYYAMKEGACSEQSSRMTAMDNSSKNAGEMIDKLRITFNRQNSTGCHYWRADRDHFRRCCALSHQPTSRLECG